MAGFVLAETTCRAEDLAHADSCTTKSIVCWVIKKSHLKSAHQVRILGVFDVHVTQPFLNSNRVALSLIKRVQKFKRHLHRKGNFSCGKDNCIRPKPLYLDVMPSLKHHLSAKRGNLRKVLGGQRAAKHLEISNFSTELCRTKQQHILDLKISGSMSTSVELTFTWDETLHFSHPRVLERPSLPESVCTDPSCDLFGIGQICRPQKKLSLCCVQDASVHRKPTVRAGALHQD